MISFNDLKNNVEIMKNYLKQMHFFNQKSNNIKYSQFQEDYLRKNFPNIFLEILHFVLIQFSFRLFEQILQQCPTIRTDNDMPFIQHTILISRNLLKLDVKIDSNQFFSPNKFFQKKVELVSKICKGVYEFETSQTKGSSNYINSMNTNKSKLFPKSQTNKSSKTAKNYIQDEDDQDMPRQINVVPTKKVQPASNANGNNFQSNKHKNNSNSDSDQQLKLLRERKNKIQNISLQPKQFSKYQQKQEIVQKKTVSRLNRNIQLSKQEKQQAKNNNINGNYQGKNKSNATTQKVHFNAQNANKYNKNLEEQSQQQQQCEEYMTKKQVLQIMSALNTNISSLINNFNNFQKDVSTWMNNINAKVSLLEQNVKTIRNNL